MKISHIYLKMLMVFILVQITAILTMIVLVRSGKIRPPFTRHIEERVVAIKQLVRHELKDSKTITPELGKDLNEVLAIFANSFQGKVWITNADETIVARSFSKGLPFTGRERVDFEVHPQDDEPFFASDHKPPFASEERPNFDRKGGRLDDERDHFRSREVDSFFVLKHDEMKSLYAIGTIQFNNAPLTIHVLKKWKKRKEEQWFFEGLLVMSSIAALLLIPVSRRLTKPLNKLTDAAEQIAQGDFSPRVHDKRKDELGLLGRAFNHMAESLEKMIRGGRELTANLSHELRSPLARIRISQQIIQERMEAGRTDGIEKHVGKMETEIDHMDGLIDKILTLSKLDLQEFPREDVVDVGDLLEATLERHQAQIAEKGMTIQQEIEPTPAYRCNRENIRIVLDNAVANAVKYGPKDGTLTVATKEDADQIHVSVTNPYRSVSEQELETIFIPFKRLGYDDVEGSGLGLAFAKRIVEEHGGTISASHAEGNFCMTILLPIE